MNIYNILYIIYIIYINQEADTLKCSCVISHADISTLYVLSCSQYMYQLTFFTGGGGDCDGVTAGHEGCQARNYCS